MSPIGVYEHKRRSLEERFWAKVQRTENQDKCWLWLAGRDINGYGRIGTGGHDGPTHLAHRVSYRLATGNEPGALFVCHSCDNPPCVNPRHLFLGTNTDNLRDASKKGLLRGIQAGERHPRAKLTESDVRAIRDAVRNGRSVASLAREYGMSQSTLSRVWRGLRWSHIA